MLLHAAAHSLPFRGADRPLRPGSANDFDKSSIRQLALDQTPLLVRGVPHLQVPTPSSARARVATPFQMCKRRQSGFSMANGSHSPECAPLRTRAMALDASIAALGNNMPLRHGVAAALRTGSDLQSISSCPERRRPRRHHLRS